jgi:hypothetical protein
VSLATAYQQMVERALFGRQAFTAPPATIYAAAFVGGTEQTTGGWARATVPNNTTTFPSADPLVNGVAIDFPTLSTPTVGVTSIRFYDASSGGNEIGRSDDFAATDVDAGEFLRVPAGSLTIAVT